MVLEDFMTEFSEADHEDVAMRDEVFKRVSADFSCEIGKVGQHKQPPFQCNLLTI